MPADNGIWLYDRQCIENSSEQPIETNEYKSVDGTEGGFPRRSTPQDVYLFLYRSFRAKALGLEVPGNLSARADEFIE